MSVGNPTGVQYLRCSKRADSKSCDGCGTLRTREFERFLYGEMVKKLSEFQTLTAKRETVNPKLTALNMELARVEEEIEKLLNTLTGANAVLLSYANSKIEELDTHRQALTKEIAALSAEIMSPEQIERLSVYLNQWEEIDFEDRRQVADGLISQIRATDEHVSIVNRTVVHRFIIRSFSRFCSRYSRPSREEYRIFHSREPTERNLGAQAGVRYSITNPDAYVEANLIGFYNILEACRHSYDEGHTPVEHPVYASSSSVYGSNKKVPYSTDDKVDNPVSLYAATKKSNELMAHAYSKPYLEKQKQFIEKVVSYLENRGLQPRKLGVTDYDMDAPLTAIRRLLLESNGLIKFNGFLAPKAEGSYLILNEGGYQIEGQTDTWKVIDEKNVQEQRFVQLVCEQTKKQKPDIVLHDSGVLVAQTIYGFDSSVMKKIEKFLREQKPELLHHQKFLENGTAERAKESGTEQNYNMIDGCVNNNPKKPRIIGNRISVLDRLHIKLEERKQKSQPQQQQQQERSRKN